MHLSLMCGNVAPRCSRGGRTARWTSTDPGISTRWASGTLLGSTGSVRPEPRPADLRPVKMVGSEQRKLYFVLKVWRTCSTWLRGRTTSCWWTWRTSKETSRTLGTPRSPLVQNLTATDWKCLVSLMEVQVRTSEFANNSKFSGFFFKKV